MCEKITASMKVLLPNGEKLELKYLTEAGQAKNPSYGIPVCFSLTKYHMDEDNSIQPVTDFEIHEMSFGEWHRKPPRETEPLKPTSREFKFAKSYW